MEKNDGSPVLTQRRSGDWLAAARNGRPFRIAVTGQTVDEARLAFELAIKQWVDLLRRDQ